MCGSQNAAGICLKFSLDCLKWLPVIFIVLVLGYSYYAYNVVLCLGFVHNVVEKCIYIAFYHVFLLLLMVTYARTIVEPYKACPQEFHLSSNELYEYVEKTSDPKLAGEYMLNIVRNRHLPIYTRNPEGYPRYCAECVLLKPDRAHHCAACHMCHLKMDHHCVWVNTCVAHHNYKYFVLLLVHGCILCLYIVGTSVKYFIQYWKEFMADSSISHVNLIILFILACVFFLNLLFLGIYHVYLVLFNRTTLEASRPVILASGSDSNAFNVGKYENFRDVFGNNPLTWFLPFGSSRGDGVHWVMRLEHYQSDYQSL
jgi:palmitoyltransferase ZDHHC2/15/20